jgi:hypothetical protein
LANYLFYTSLVTHFLEAVLKFVHIDPEAVLQMTYKVCIVLSLFLRKYIAVPYEGDTVRLHNQESVQSILEVSW